MPVPRGKNIDIWRWIPSGDDPCPTCESMRGDYAEEPAAPHPNCKCVCVKMEKQINPRNRPPYQVGFQLSNAGIDNEKSDTWTVVITCMGYTGDPDEEEDDEEWEPRESHYGSIDLPAMPGGLSNEEAAAWTERQQSALHDYARELFEGHCIGWV